MDDALEQPTAVAPLSKNEEEENQPSDNEEGGLDWTKLQPSISRPIIPKRGEKDFEPSTGSHLQLYFLDKARSAMFDTLRATRDISSKSVSYAMWYPGISRAHVTSARGIHFSSMGHSVARSDLSGGGDLSKVHKRLELIPEEAVYLIERGALFCWKEHSAMRPDEPGLEDVDGSPMTVQQAFTEMIGRDNSSLEKYQVYAYLKRLGYVVTRAEAPSPQYPLPSPSTSKPSSSYGIIHRTSSIFSSWLSKLQGLFLKRFNWWRPLRIQSWARQKVNYGSIFKALRFLPAGFGIPITQIQAPCVPSPYKVFYNIYKPSTPFRKTAPPAPDFFLVVIDARTTPMPSLHELHSLFDGLPEIPPPLPRQRRPATGNNTPHESKHPRPPEKTPPPPSPTILSRIVYWIFPRPSPEPPTGPRPNPFMALKAGKKNVIIAAVDAGNISFFRFGQGAFSDWPMI